MMYTRAATMVVAAMTGLVCAAGLTDPTGAQAASPASRPAGLELFVAGTLADYDHRPLESARADAAILATDGGRSGIARIEVSVDGKPAAAHRIRCRPSCPASGRFQFTYERQRYGPGRHRVTITAIDSGGRVVRRTIDVEAHPAVSQAAPSAQPPIFLPAINSTDLSHRVAAGTAAVALATVAAVRQTIGAEPKGPPDAQPAFYLTAANATDLRHQAADDAASFARSQGPGPALLVLDFGAARHRGEQWGVSLRSGTFFSNRDVASALEAAARAYEKNYQQGDVTIVYANTNAHLGDPGTGYKPLTARTAAKAGRQQALTVRGLHLDPHEAAAAGGDIEPGYPNTAPPKVSIALVAGAAAGGDAYYNVGTAPCTQNTCVNGWTVHDVCAVNSGGGRLALPEIYFETPESQVAQWAAIQDECGIKVFAGASASKLGHFAPSQSWLLLGQQSKVGVGPALVVFPE